MYLNTNDVTTTYGYVLQNILVENNCDIHRCRNLEAEQNKKQTFLLVHLEISVLRHLTKYRILDLDLSSESTEAKMMIYIFQIRKENAVNAGTLSTPVGSIV